MPRLRTVVAGTLLIVAAFPPGVRGFETSSTQLFDTGPEVSALAAGVALDDDAAWRNPASAGMLNRSSVSLWTARPYGLTEVTLMGAHATWLFRSVGSSLQFRSLSFDRYHEQTMVVQAAHALGAGRWNGLRLGAGIRVGRRSGARGGVNWSASLVTGLLLSVSGRASFGMRLRRNIHSSSRFDAGDGESVLAGVAYDMSDSVSLYADVFSERYYPVSVRYGISARPVESIEIRMGLSTEPPRRSLGVLLYWSALTASIAFDRHDILGWSSAVGVGYVISDRR